MNNIFIIKKSGIKEKLDISKIQKNSQAATFGLAGVNQSELEVDSHLKFIDGMTSTQIQDTLIKTAVEKIDIDCPNWTYVAARLSLFDLYHEVGRVLGTEKGNTYGHLKDYISYGQKEEKLIYSLHTGYDLEFLNNSIVPDRDYLFNYLGFKTLKDRYLFKNNDNKIFELPQHMFMGIAMFLAQNEEDKNNRAVEFYNVISQFEVMLATPTLSNARGFRHQLSSCYIGASPDNIEGIFDGYGEMGLLSKYGGGIGWDWHDIRSLGGSIDNNKNASSGPIPFLKVTNDVAIAVDQLGVRKGAIAVYLEPWHMDIQDFLDLKKNSGEERRRAHELFPALWISDEFMNRVMNDLSWTLFDPAETKDLHTLYGRDFEKRYSEYEQLATDGFISSKTIKAKDLWKKILTSYFESGSPFLCFKDTANVSNPNKHAGVIRSSNLCTEIFQNTSPNYYKIKLTVDNLSVGSVQETLVFDEEDLIEVIGLDHKIKAKKVTSLNTIVWQNMKYKVYCCEKEKINGETAVCNLASVNLSKINTKEDIERVVPIAIRMLDNVIDLNFYPLKKVKDTNLKTRAIGLGAMGEAQMLAEKGIMYGSQEHFKCIDYIYECISYNTIKTSSELGRLKENYPNFKGSDWSKGIMPQDHYSQALVSQVSAYSKSEWDVLRDVASKNMRNGYLMAIAPTSSISILVGTTQATEPVYKRKWYEENMSGLIPVVAPNLSPETWEFYIPAYDVDQKDIVKAAAIRQKWIDQGQSTNVFMKLENATGRHLHEIYTLAWQLGLKSTYYLRGQSAEATKEKVDVADRSVECQGCQ